MGAMSSTLSLRSEECVASTPWRPGSTCGAATKCDGKFPEESTNTATWAMHQAQVGPSPGTGAGASLLSAALSMDTHCIPCGVQTSVTGPLASVETSNAPRRP